MALITWWRRKHESRRAVVQWWLGGLILQVVSFADLSVLFGLLELCIRVEGLRLRGGRAKEAGGLGE